jgi:hypothetical protein
MNFTGCEESPNTFCFEKLCEVCTEMAEILELCYRELPRLIPQTGRIKTGGRVCSPLFQQPCDQISQIFFEKPHDTENIDVSRLGAFKTYDYVSRLRLTYCKFALCIRILDFSCLASSSNSQQYQSRLWSENNCSLFRL